MMADSPADMHRLFANAFNAHDLDALVALYEAEAVLVPRLANVPSAKVRSAKPWPAFFPAFKLLSLRHEALSNGATSRCCIRTSTCTVQGRMANLSRWKDMGRRSYGAKLTAAGCSSLMILSQRLELPQVHDCGAERRSW